jgi:DUF177 domain-containing protein
MKLDLDRQGSGQSELEIDGVLELGLPDGRPDQTAVRGTLRVDDVESRVRVTGTLSATGQSECARCLEDFEHSWEARVEITVLRKVDSDEGEGDSLVLQQTRGEVDLVPPLRECVILAFPQAPVCAEDCRGICVQCGADLNQTKCDCTQDDVDPRWEALP